MTGYLRTLLSKPHIDTVIILSRLLSKTHFEKFGAYTAGQFPGQMAYPSSKPFGSDHMIHLQPPEMNTFQHPGLLQDIVTGNNTPQSPNVPALASFMHQSAEQQQHTDVPQYVDQHGNLAHITNNQPASTYDFHVPQVEYTSQISIDEKPGTSMGSLGNQTSAGSRSEQTNQTSEHQNLQAGMYPCFLNWLNLAGQCYFVYTVRWYSELISTSTIDFSLEHESTLWLGFILATTTRNVKFYWIFSNLATFFWNFV